MGIIILSIIAAVVLWTIACFILIVICEVMIALLNRFFKWLLRER